MFNAISRKQSRIQKILIENDPVSSTSQWNGKKSGKEGEFQVKMYSRAITTKCSPWTSFGFRFEQIGGKKTCGNYWQLFNINQILDDTKE